MAAPAPASPTPSLRRRHWLGLLTLGGAGGLRPARAQGMAADWPSRPIRLIVPQGTAGGLDSLARVLAKGLSAELKQPIVVENKPGASGNLGAEFVAHAPPDGYTLLLAVNQLATMIPHLFARPSFNPLTDLVPVSQVTMGSGYILAVTNGLPVRSVAELIAYGKQHPGKLAFGSYGVGSGHHLSGELLKSRAGIDMIHVPYKQTPSVDLISGQIQVLFDSHVALKEQVRAGTIRALAVTSPQRQPAFPDLPAMNETFPGFDVVGWHGIWVPRGTPQPLVDKLNAALARTVHTPDMRQQIQHLNFEPTGTSQQQIQELIRTESQTWADAIRKANIRIES